MRPIEIETEQNKNQTDVREHAITIIRKSFKQ